MSQAAPCRPHHLKGKSAGHFRKKVELFACPRSASKCPEVPNDVLDLTSGRLYVPAATEAVSNSLAGYIVADSRWRYEWDWRRRLTGATSLHRSTNVVLSFDYYPGGQRAQKRVWQVVGGVTQGLREAPPFFKDIRQGGNPIPVPARSAPSLGATARPSLR